MAAICRGCGQSVTGQHACPGPFAMQRPESVVNNKQRDAARVMYDALRRIAEADAFFDGEKLLKEIAAGALREVEHLSRS